MTKREEALYEARQFIERLRLRTNVDEAEAAKALQLRYRLTRQEIADVLGLTLRQTMTRLVEFKTYAAGGLIPTGILQVYTQEEPHDAVVADEVERMRRGLLNIESKQIIDGSIFEERFALAVAQHLPSERDMSHVDGAYAYRWIDRKMGDNGDEAAVIIMSDWHLGLVNHEYDDEIAKRVLERYITKCLRLTELHRTQCDVRTVYFCPIGDNLQGSTGNFAAQRWTVHDTAIDQAEMLTAELVKVIERLLVEYDNVVVVPRKGNHGNLYPSKTSLEPAHANIETVVHRTLRWAFRDHNRVDFVLNDEEWYTVTNFMGVRALITHGDTIPGSGNFDGILTTFRKLGDILPVHDIAIIGHFHRRASLPLPTPFGSQRPRTLYLNGTSIRGDSFTEQYGAAHSNQWWNLFVNHERVTAEYAVSLYD